MLQMSTLETQAIQFHFRKAFDYSKYNQSHRTQDFNKARLHAEAGLLVQINSLGWSDVYKEWCESVGIESYNASNEQSNYIKKEI